MRLKHSITASFLAPLLDLKDKAPVNLIGPYYEDAYSADAMSEKYKDWGTHVLLLFNKDLPKELSEYLQTSQYYVEDYEPSLVGYRMFVFKLPEETLEGYVKHVLAGEYSKADKTVVDRFFPNTPSSPRYGNRLVFEKSDLWRKDWESKIGMSLPEGAEVWPRPTPKRETYGYIAENTTPDVIDVTPN